MKREVPRVALTTEEAAYSLGVGKTTFKEQIAPDLRVIRRGTVRLYPVQDLRQWADENAERTLS